MIELDFRDKSGYRKKEKKEIEEMDDCARELFCLRRWEHETVTGDSHFLDVAWIVIKLKKSNFLGLFIRYFGNPALMPLVLPHCK